MLKEFFEVLKNSEIVQQNPGILVLVIFIFTFLLSLNPIFDFFNSGNEFFNKIRYAKYLKSKEIYEDSITNEQNRSIAKEIVDSSQFEQLTGINIDRKSRQKLTILAKQSEDKNIWIHIRNSIKYLSFDKDLPEIVPETPIRIAGRYFFNFCASLFAVLLMLCSYILIFIELPINYYIYNIFFIFVFYLLFIYFLRKTSYFYSLKKLDKTIKHIKKSLKSENN